MRSLMTPWLVIPAAVAMMAAVLLAAVRADCVRLAEAHDAEVRVVDDELVKLERRWLELALAPYDEVKKKSQRSIYDAASEIDERHAAFRRGLDAPPLPFRNEEPQVNTDELQGIFNRWEIMERDYLKRAAERDAFMNSWRGKIAAGRASTGDEAK